MSANTVCQLLKGETDHEAIKRIMGMLYGLTKRGSKGRFLLRYMTSSGWRDRIWVVQEAVLVPKSTIVLPSGEELAWSDLVRFTIWIDSHEPHLLQKLFDVSAHEPCACLHEFKRNYSEQWFELLRLRDNVYRLLQVDKPERDHSEPGFIDVLLAVRDHDSSEPRDEIFGILSPGHNWGGLHPIKADYTNWPTLY